MSPGGSGPRGDLGAGREALRGARGPGTAGQRRRPPGSLGPGPPAPRGPPAASGASPRGASASPSRRPGEPRASGGAEAREGGARLPAGPSARDGPGGASARCYTLLPVVLRSLGLRLLFLHLHITTRIGLFPRSVFKSNAGFKKHKTHKKCSPVPALPPAWVDFELAGWAGALWGSRAQASLRPWADPPPLRSLPAAAALLVGSCDTHRVCPVARILPGKKPRSESPSRRKACAKLSCRRKRDVGSPHLGPVPALFPEGGLGNGGPVPWSPLCSLIHNTRKRTVLWLNTPSESGCEKGLCKAAAALIRGREPFSCGGPFGYL